MCMKKTVPTSKILAKNTIFLILKDVLKEDNTAAMESTKTKEKLDWANSAPTYPQTGHHSRNMF